MAVESRARPVSVSMSAAPCSPSAAAPDPGCSSVLAVWVVGSTGLSSGILSSGFNDRGGGGAARVGNGEEVLFAIDLGGLQKKIKYLYLGGKKEKKRKLQKTQGSYWHKEFTRWRSVSPS